MKVYSHFFWHVVLIIVFAILFLPGIKAQTPTADSRIISNEARNTSGEKRGSSLGLQISPEVAMPVGGNAELYSTGFGGRLTGLLGLRTSRLIAPRFDLGYSYIPLDTSEDAALSLIRGTAGAQATFVFTDRFSLFGYGGIGGYYGTLNGPNPATDAYLGYLGGGGLGFQLFDDVSLNLGGEYVSYTGTLDGFSIFLGVTTRLSGRGGGAVPLANFSSLRPGALPASGYIDIGDVRLDTVFPVLRKYYDTVPIGKAQITNTGEKSLEDVEVRVKPAAYIDSPKLSVRIPALEPGETRSVDLYVLFNEEILGVSEGAKVVTDIDVFYRIGGRDGVDTETVTLETYDRNALQWDDDRKIAAFVTAKDDEIQRFAKNMASIARDVRVGAVNEQLQLAMAEYEAMIQQGLAYVVDPSSSYEVLSENPLVVDYVQFPRQTLYVKAGDCDDLSATYCTLLESIGIDTAFITVPGHIFMAFRVEMDERTAHRSFSEPKDLIFREDGTVWLPVETTLLEKGFLSAWAEGARQWRSNEPEGQTRFFPTAEAWKTYQPVAFSVSTIELGLPARDQVVAAVSQQLKNFIDQEIHPQEKALRARLESRPNDPRLLNQLGILYARYGRYSDARREFEQLLTLRSYTPTIINLANIHYIEGNLGRARRRYEDALEQDEDNTAALLGLARVEHELENFGSARSAYEKLALVSPDVAEANQYLLSRTSAGDEIGRASSIGNRQSGIVWEEEK